MSTVIQTYTFSCPGCCGSGRHCVFCPDGYDLPPTFNLTISGSPVVSGTFPHDYTIFNNTYAMVQGTLDTTPTSGVMGIDDFTGVTPSTTSYDWICYYQTVELVPAGSLYNCVWTSVYVKLSCGGVDGGTGYRVEVTIKQNTVLVFSSSTDCSAHLPTSVSGARHYYILDAGTVSPSNTGNASDSLIGGSTSTSFYVPFSTGDSCSPLYLSSVVPSCQLVYIFDVTFSTGTADDVTSTLTITLHP